MKTKTLIEITNPHEVARLLNLIRDGIRIIEMQGRNQRGIDGYTRSDLAKWGSELSKHTNVECKYADGEMKEDLIDVTDKDAESILNEYLKAINYSQCCATLKEKKALSFEGFKDEFYYKAQMGIYESKASGMFYNLTDLEKRYKKYCERF